ncbi:septin 5b isoform X2 [Fundulus heteroclitus]|uniref:septin 5b isoform X2 n=1 Tax=Fundulus heteroclitus TaxID=8078 RepID=UPI00165CA5AE|nr:septin 5b isoform X2 [Fundulus heteroclitus]
MSVYCSDLASLRLGSHPFLFCCGDGGLVVLRPAPLTSRLPASSTASSMTSNSRYRSRAPRADDAEDREYVGFATLPRQLHRKSVKKGFDFTLMVAGEFGLGKSTLVNSLFLTDLYKERKLLNAEERIKQTVEITKHTVDIEEKGVKLKLTIVDVPGFGDAINNTECWTPVTDYINQQFEQYFRDESGLNRKNIQDNRVHCCLYFISPFGQGLRPIDVEFMKALQDKVNVVPLIAKADCLTPSEIKKLKEQVREEIDKYGIKIYQFPDCDSDEDEEIKNQDKGLKESLPFAVIGGNTVVEVRGQRVRGRLYPWGIVEVENPSHCDFGKLRNMLIRTHMHDLKDTTNDCHYENYRAQCIQNMTRAHLHFLHLFPALTTDHNVICKHHSPWRFLSDLICQPVHHQSKRGGAQSRSLMPSHFLFELLSTPTAHLITF